MKSLLGGVRRLWNRADAAPLNTFGAAVLRIGLATTMIVIYLVNFRSRLIIWGSDGQLSYADYAAAAHSDYLALYRYSDAIWYVDALYVASIAIAAIYITGWASRIFCWLFAVTVYAAIVRDPLAFDSGSILLRLLAFYLCLVDTGRHLTLFSSRRRPGTHTASKFSNLCHNVGMLVIACQICMVYFWSGFYKIAGLPWRHGIALQAVLENPRFRVVPGIDALLLQHPNLLAALTFLTIVVQMGFAYLMWIPRLKPPLVAIAIGLHVTIAIVMGLFSFSMVMISADLALLSDGFWSQLRAYVVPFVARLMPSRIAALRLEG